MSRALSLPSSNTNTHIHTHTLTHTRTFFILPLLLFSSFDPSRKCPIIKNISTTNVKKIIVTHW